MIKIGDRIVIRRWNSISQIRVVSFGERRESFDLAKKMYEDEIEQILKEEKIAQGQTVLKPKDGFRPNKKDRRAIIKMKKSKTFFCK